jgi:hypothetical protein
MLDNGVSGTGTAEVKQAITAEKSHYVSQPISTVTSEVFTGGFAASWDEASSDWNPLSTAELQVMEGYSLYFTSDKTLSFSGTTNSGNKSYPLTKLGSGFNLVGNPYPSALDWDNSAWGKTDVDNTVYFWNGTNYSYYKGTGGTNPGGTIFVNNGTRYIPAMQGFFVKSKVDNGTLSVTNDARVHATQSYYKSDETNIIKIIATHGNQTDETAIYFATGLTDEANGDEDAWKLFTTVAGVPQVYTSMAGQDLAINGLTYNENRAPIALGFFCTDSGTCNLQLSENLVSNIRALYLEDLKENTLVNLTENPVYTFEHHSRNSNDRFRLHFNSPTKVNFNDAMGIEIFGLDNELHINSIGITGNLNIEIFTITGKKVYQTEIAAGSTNSVTPGLPTSVYVVKVISAEKVVTKKVYL